MDIQADINWIQQKLQGITNPNLVLTIKSLIQREETTGSTDWAELLSEEEKTEIREGIAELDRGEKFSYESVMKEYR